MEKRSGTCLLGGRLSFPREGMNHFISYNNFCLEQNKVAKPTELLQKLPEWKLR